MKMFGKNNGAWVLAIMMIAGGAVSTAPAFGADAALPAAPSAAPTNITEPTLLPPVTSQAPAAATPPSAAPVMPQAPGQMVSKPPPSKGGKPALHKGAAAGGVTASSGSGPKVTDMLAAPANIRPLPEKYLVVKKDHDADDVDSRLTAARRALSQGHNQAALELFNALYTKDPHDKRVLVGRAVTLQKLGLNSEALSAYKEALTNDPKNLEALTNMLGILGKEDQGMAIDKLRELQGVYPANADIAAQLGTLSAAASDYPQALKYLDIADALRPGNIQILYNRAVVYDRMGNAQKAVDLYHQIILLARDGDAEQGPMIEAIKERLAAIR